MTDGPAGDQYPNSAQCEWIVAPLDGGPTRLDFTRFDMESGYDFVRVYEEDGAGGARTMVGEFSGADIPGPVYVTDGNRMVVRMETDGSVAQTGFDATWSRATAAEVDEAKDSAHSCFDAVMNGEETGVDCGGNDCAPCSGQCFGTTMVGSAETSARGSFADGSTDGNNYENNLACRFLVVAPDDMLVRLTFTFLETETNYDFVRIYDGTDEFAPLLGELSGAYGDNSIARIGNNFADGASEGGRWIYSTGPRILVTFHSDGSVNEPGWTAAYQIRSTTAERNNDAATASTASVAGAVLVGVVALIVVGMGAVVAKRLRHNNRLTRQLIVTYSTHAQLEEEKNLLSAHSVGGEKAANVDAAAADVPASAVPSSATMNPRSALAAAVEMGERRSASSRV